MDAKEILTCVFVFLSVVGSYLLARVWMDAPKGAAVAGDMSAPAMFRALAALINPGASSFGVPYMQMHPERAKKYAEDIARTGWTLSPEQLYAARLLYTLLFGAGTMFFIFILSGEAAKALGFGIPGALFGWSMPYYAVLKRGQVRQTAIIRELPFAIDLMTTAMEAGRDFSAAVRDYVNLGAKGDLAVEFDRMLREKQLGKSNEEALQKMAFHVQTREFSAFVAAAIHGAESGGSIAETLRIQGDDMRRARFNLAEKKAAQASSKMILPMALFILPSVFAIIMVPVVLRYMAAKGGM